MIELSVVVIYSHDPCFASGGGADLPACGPPASFCVHLASSTVTLAGYVHKSMGDNVICVCHDLNRCSGGGMSAV